jgi:hypothetical protein
MNDNLLSKIVQNDTKTSQKDPWLGKTAQNDTQLIGIMQNDT